MRQVTRMPRQNQSADFAPAPQRPRQPVENGNTFQPLRLSHEQLSFDANMPKALPGVGLASCIVQLLDYSTKVLQKDYEVYRLKDTRSVLENGHLLRIVTHELYRLVEAIDATKLKRPVEDKKNAKSDDAAAIQQLLKLSDTTSEQITPLIDAFCQVQTKCTPSDPPYVTVREGLLTVWNKGQISNTRKKLQLLRKELDTALLRLLRCVVAPWLHLTHVLTSLQGAS